MRRQHFITVLLLLAIMIGSACAADLPSLEALPASVEFQTDATPPQVLVVLRNTSDKPWHDIQLAMFPDAYASSNVVASTQPSKLAASEAMSWQLRLPAHLPRPIPDSLRIVATYKTVDDAGKRTNQLLSTSVDVKPRKAETVSDVADVKLLSDADSLQDKQNFRLKVSVENKSDTQLQVTSIDLVGESFVELRGKPTILDVIQPRHVQVVDLPCVVKDVISPGKRTLVVAIGLSWGPSAAKATGNVVVSREFTLAVMGVSEILGTLSIPSLLLLPGYLIVICTVTIWSLGEVSSTLQLWKDIAKPGTLIVALSLSLGITILYSRVFDRNFSVAYGLQDVIYLWLGSIVVGLTAGGLAVVCRWTWARSKQRALAQAAYFESDSPQDVLRKLDLNGGGWTLSFVQVNDGANPYNFFKLPERHPLNGKAFGISSIVIDGSRGNPAGTNVQDALNHTTAISSKEMATLLDAGVNTYGWRITWRGGLKPRRVDATLFDPANKQADIVEFA
jgi:hypothetical protein